MNRILKISPIFLLLACSTGHIVTTNLHNLANFEENSQVYSLPKTRIIVSLTVDKTEYIPGPYQQYAKKYLEIEGVQSFSSYSYVITDVKLHTQVIPDQDYCFSIRNENFGEIEPILSDLRAKGLIMQENILLNYEQNLKSQSEQEICPYLAIKPFFFNEDLLGQNSFDISEFSKTPFLKKQIGLKTIEEKAEAAATFLFKLRKRRFNLLAAKYAIMPEGVALEKSIEELNKLEQEYLSLFIGRTKTTSITKKFMAVPTDEGKVQQFTLLRFSGETGFRAVEGKEGEAIVLQLTDLETNQTISQLHRSGTSNQYYDVLHYREADWANAKVLFGSHEILESEISVFQFGAIVPKYVSPHKK